MSKTVNERLSALREVMQREHLAAFIFPSTDPHNGEYVPDHWKGREWISGFNGSAGTAVVTMDSARFPERPPFLSGLASSCEVPLLQK